MSEISRKAQAVLQTAYEDDLFAMGNETLDVINLRRVSVSKCSHGGGSKNQVPISIGRRVKICGYCLLQRQKYQETEQIWVSYQEAKTLAKKYQTTLEFCLDLGQ